MKIQELLIKGYDELKASQIESYMLDSQLLLAHVLNVDKLSIVINRFNDVDSSKAEEFMKLIKLRAKKMPVKYILGNAEFMGLNFAVREGILIPRPDTEILVENVIDLIKAEGFKRISDVCCGSGAIGLSIAKYVPDSYVYLSDISDTAVEVSSVNARQIGVSERTEIIKSDLLEFASGLNEKFQVIVSNPPYIRRDEIPELMEDVKLYEPYEALCGGEDGLDFYRRITSQAVKYLECGGLLAFEIGWDEGEEVQNILRDKGFKDIQRIKDLGGNERVVLGKKMFFSNEPNY